jgi:hypothetical protein
MDQRADARKAENEGGELDRECYRAAHHEDVGIHEPRVRQDEKPQETHRRQEGQDSHSKEPKQPSR